MGKDFYFFGNIYNWDVEDGDGSRKRLLCLIVFRKSISCIGIIVGDRLYLFRVVFMVVFSIVRLVRFLYILGFFRKFFGLWERGS